MIPKDPIMLLSYVNTQLRDNYASLSDMCDDMDICVDDITDKLESAGYKYSPEDNKFIRQ